jgi:NAD(P)-dependent dehydrogenase (short-subunit alcohol dehydrogenase family)
MAVNFESMFMICQALLPAMETNRYGRIVNMASTTVGAVIPGFAHYIASKAAVIGFTRALATEAAIHGITVNCIAPGLTRTPMTEKVFVDGAAFDVLAQMQAIKRTEVPGDLVGGMSFLTSDDSAFITGQTLIIDGGFLRSL